LALYSLKPPLIRAFTPHLAGNDYIARQAGIGQKKAQAGSPGLSLFDIAEGQTGIRRFSTVVRTDERKIKTTGETRDILRQGTNTAGIGRIDTV
jgi:hypothetical protein